MPLDRAFKLTIYVDVDREDIVYVDPPEFKGHVYDTLVRYHGHICLWLPFELIDSNGYLFHTEMKPWPRSIYT